MQTSITWAGKNGSIKQAAALTDGDEGMTPRTSIFAYPVPAKEEARSKDTRSPQGPALRLGVEGENYL
jgi:hypothetical protein